jgi:hypothetical protein
MRPGLWYMDTELWFNKDIQDEEKLVFADLLGKLLKLVPEERISAEKALEHE